jgi:hypothetical protein
VTRPGAVLAILALATLTHVGYFAVDRDHFLSDSRSYRESAESLLAGRGFTRAGQVETRRTPGYPLLIAAFGALGIGPRGLALAQHLAAAAMAALWLSIVQRMTGQRFIALAAAGLLAVDLSTILYANRILTETLDTLFVLPTFVLAWRVGEGLGRPPLEAGMAGLLTGLSALVRPIGVAYFIPLALYFGWTRRHAAWRVLPLFLAGALLFPVLWIARNYHATGVPVLASITGETLLWYRAAGVLALGEPGSFAANQQRHAAALRAEVDARIRQATGVADVVELPHAQRAAWYGRTGIEILLRHPGAYATLVLRGIAATLLGSDAELVTRLTGLSGRWVEYLLRVATGLALLLAVLGQLYLLKTNPRLGVLVLVTVAYFVLVSAGGESNSRFRVPVSSMYALLVAAGVYALRERWRAVAVTRSTRRGDSASPPDPA